MIMKKPMMNVANNIEKNIYWIKKPPGAIFLQTRTPSATGTPRSCWRRCLSKPRTCTATSCQISFQDKARQCHWWSCKRTSPRRATAWWRRLPTSRWLSLLVQREPRKSNHKQMSFQFSTWPLACHYIAYPQFDWPDCTDVQVNSLPASVQL